MKKAIYTVLTKTGKEYTWTFTECKNDGDYGNGIYIGVKSPSGDISSIDCRYAVKYDFRKMCVDYLLGWYGDNLDELSEEF